ncbi:glycosyl hydrolase [Polaribacter reichenbachii]|uniref:Glycosyl hydrolase n=1 Tax=Polaribacter reichenbachii TaxID=996801 RepID=A0A1B8TV83_9FLAO|nr:glycoside hydrolase family 3 C-terminal domain-containing protein [Polaribacter reichenbachii]APZ45504.1 glycosyl hydrolase [Polaribacter reichenbachii]AUC19365.1 glycosyl hydrolase [Polaribacter reichenbachii]OBY63480.1 glycosyl hydrolase [Polaribacter reichenbachii]
MKKLYLFVSIILLSLFISCKKEAPNNTTDKEIQEPKFAWNNTSFTINERVNKLIAEMTLEEKVSQMLDVCPSIERLGIPEYNWWNEALHGVARNGRATVFPQAIGLGATFDPDLILKVGTVISDEARAKYNEAIKINNRSRYAGLTFWSPNVNIFRDPRWGRGQETYGEDPFLTSKIGVSFVKGLQGDDPNYIKAAACAKHYAVHSGPEEFRHSFNAVVNKKDLFETYLPAFEALVKEGNVEGVMGAYNRTLGEPCCGSPYLLQDILREDWGFKGYIVSDCGAIADFHRFHKVTQTPEESAALALKSGTNINCGNVYKVLENALNQGLITLELLDTRLKENLITRFKLGMFDPIGTNPYDHITADVVDSKEHRKIALEAAQKSIVLLKNKNNILPLKKDIRTLYVVGPNASNEEVLLGNYYGLTSNTQTILDGIVGKVSPGTSINYKSGVLPFRENVNPIDWSTGEAGESDVCIAVMGISALLEGEEGEAIASSEKGDRTGIKLPENQINYIKKIRSKTKKPIVLVLTGGSPIAIPELYDLVDAVLFVWYPGEEGGTAVADVIFGDVSPSGKLPITFPKSVSQLPAYEDYNMKGRTYKYMKEEPLFPFGFGLTYTNFEYKDLQINDNYKTTVTISNTGKADAEEVVQLYISSPLAGEKDPIYDLKAFKRVFVKAGTSKTITFNLSKDSFHQFNEGGSKVIRKGAYQLYVNGALPSERSELLGSSKAIKTTINF